MVIMGAMKANFWLAFVAATTLIFGAAYTLWMYKRVIFGAVANDACRGAEGPESRASSCVLGAARGRGAVAWASTRCPSPR